MTSKAKSPLSQEERKVFNEIQSENNRILVEARSGKRPDRSKLNDLTNQMRKLKGLEPLKPEPKLEDKKKEPKTETLTSSPVIIGETDKGPIIMLSSTPMSVISLEDKKDSKYPVKESTKKGLVKIPKKRLKQYIPEDKKDDVVIVDKPKEDPKFTELQRMFENLSKDQREKLIKSGEAPKSGWSLFS